MGRYNWVEMMERWGRKQLSEHQAIGQLLQWGQEASQTLIRLQARVEHLLRQEPDLVRQLEELNPSSGRADAAGAGAGEPPETAQPGQLGLRLTGAARRTTFPEARRFREGSGAASTLPAPVPEGGLRAKDR